MDKTESGERPIQLLDACQTRRRLCRRCSDSSSLLLNILKEKNCLSRTSRDVLGFAVVVPDYVQKSESAVPRDNALRVRNRGAQRQLTSIVVYKMFLYRTPIVNNPPIQRPRGGKFSQSAQNNNVEVDTQVSQSNFSKESTCSRLSKRWKHQHVATQTDKPPQAPIKPLKTEHQGSESVPNRKSPHLRNSSIFDREIRPISPVAGSAPKPKFASTPHPPCVLNGNSPELQLRCNSPEIRLTRSSCVVQDVHM